MLCSSSLSAQTEPPPHHLELVFYCTCVYNRQLRSEKSKFKRRLYFGPGNRRCALETTRQIFFSRGSSPGRRATSHCDSTFKFVAFPLVRTLSDPHSFLLGQRGHRLDCLPTSYQSRQASWPAARRSFSEILKGADAKSLHGYHPQRFLVRQAQ